MTRIEILQNLLHHLIFGIEKLERNGEAELKDLSFCQEQNVEIKSKNILKQKLSILAIIC
jgi:hypothetical protein